MTVTLLSLDFELPFHNVPISLGKVSSLHYWVWVSDPFFTVLKWLTILVITLIFIWRITGIHFASTVLLFRLRPSTEHMNSHLTRIFLSTIPSSDGCGVCNDERFGLLGKLFFFPPSWGIFRVRSLLLTLGDSFQPWALLGSIPDLYLKPKFESSRSCYLWLVCVVSCWPWLSCSDNPDRRTAV